MSHANGHRHLRRRLPPHRVQLIEEDPVPWYEHELFLVIGATLALTLSLFGHILSDALTTSIDSVYLRPLFYVAALVLGVTCLRGAGNTMRSAGSVTGANARLVVAAMSGFAVMFGSALSLFSLFALLDHLR